MEISPLSFVLLSVYSLIFGALLGAAYDILRITRVMLGVEYGKSKVDYREIVLPLIKKKAYGEKGSVKKWLLYTYIAVGDILFMTLAGVIAVLVAYAYNSGRVRAVIFLGLLLGFLLYYFTVGKLVMKLSQLLAFLVRSAVAYIVFIVMAPIRSAAKFIKNIRNNKKDKVNAGGKQHDKRSFGKRKKSAVQ